WQCRDIWLLFDFGASPKIKKKPNYTAKLNLRL
ncbi:MAG: hypothetical protein ACI81T_002396, partial [Bacteroidia bacterium]